jgi:hypothetical protein
MAGAVKQLTPLIKREQVAEMCGITPDMVDNLPLPYYQISKNIRRWSLPEVTEYAKNHRRNKLELKSLEEIHAAKKPIDTKAAVYFLFLVDELVYVGQSTYPARRIADHINGKVKAFTHYAVIECDQADLQRLEYLYIDKFKPRYNKMGVIRDVPDEI